MPDKLDQKKYKMSVENLVIPESRAMEKYIFISYIVYSLYIIYMYMPIYVKHTYQKDTGAKMEEQLMTKVRTT